MSFKIDTTCNVSKVCFLFEACTNVAVEREANLSASSVFPF